MQIKSFTKGKVDDKNEDYFGYNETCFVIADGTTDKSGRKYNEKTGGEIISRLIVEKALSSNLNGEALIKFLNKEVYQLYEKLGITDIIINATYRFSSGFIAVRIVNDKIIITNIGDLGFRINGNYIYRKKEQIGIDNAKERANYIEKTGDIEGGRKHIMPLLLKQSEYQNNPDSPLGYGIIDGTNTPSKFVKTFEYSKNEVNLIELFSDGYFAIPNGTEIEDWENAYEKAELEDPDKWKKYKSTKAKDDRTIAIIDFD